MIYHRSEKGYRLRDGRQKSGRATRKTDQYEDFVELLTERIPYLQGKPESH